jgi:hypothetical protein
MIADGGMTTEAYKISLIEKHAFKLCLLAPFPNLLPGSSVKAYWSFANHPGLLTESLTRLPFTQERLLTSVFA